MPANVLGQRTYAITAIVVEVGWLTPDEEKAISTAVGVEESGSRFDPDQHQLHLYWNVLADTMEDAVIQARATLREAQEATGVYAPRTARFEAREISDAQ